MNDVNQPNHVWKIRSAHPGDLEALVALEQACFAVPWQSRSLEHDLTEHAAARYWVAQTTAGQVIAYAAYWQMVDEAEITHIAVNPLWRRKGIAKALLQRLIDQAESDNLTAVHLEVRISNRAAQDLYCQAGFQKVSCRKNYYSDNGEDAIIMLKIISNDGS